MTLRILIHTDKHLEDWQAGAALGPVIFIRPEYRNDVGLYLHELKHVEQFWRAPLTHIWRYGHDADYRLTCEVEAYKVQIEHGMPVWMAAHYLVHRYNLDLTIDEATALLA